RFADWREQRLRPYKAKGKERQQQEQEEATQSQGKGAPNGHGRSRPSLSLHQECSAVPLWAQEAPRASLTTLAAQVLREALGMGAHTRVNAPQRTHLRS